MRRRENRELLKLIIQPVEIGNRAITSESAQSDLTLLLILFKLYSPTGFISPSGIKANKLKQKITEIEKIFIKLTATTLYCPALVGGVLQHVIIH